MATHIRQVNPQGNRVFMATITDGDLLHEALVDFAKQHNIQTATFEMLGGLHEVEFTAYDFVKQERQPPLTHRGAMEIIAGHGTISQLDGEPHIHIHLALSFRNETATHGIDVIGGHAARAVAFAVEVTLTAYDGAPVHRQLDHSTGLNLWHLED